MKRIIALISAAIFLFGVMPAQASSTASQANLPIAQCKLFGKNIMGNTVRYEDSGLTEDWSQFVRPSGQVRVLLIAQDFSDVKARTSFREIQDFAKDIESEFSRLSTGGADFEITVRQGWLRMPKTAAHYMKADWREKIDDALRLVDAQFDFNEYDMFIIKTDEKNTVVNVAGALPKWDSYVPDGLPFAHGVYLGSDGWTQEGGGLGIAIHEISHLFGLPDLYSFNDDGSRAVGLFDLMGSSGEGMQLRYMGWHLWKLGWLENQEINCLDKGKLQQFSVPASQAKIAPFVFPISNKKAFVVENWKPYSNKSAGHWVAYTIDSSMHIGAWGQPSGKYSPIQVLTPKGVKRSLEWGARNENLALNPGQSVETEIGTFKFVRGGKNLIMRFEPIGQFTNDIALPKLETKRVNIAAVSNTSVRLSSTSVRKAELELARYPAQAVRCIATVSRGSSAQVVSRTSRIVSTLCRDLGKRTPHLEASHAVLRTGPSSTKPVVSLEVTY